MAFNKKAVVASHWVLLLGAIVQGGKNGHSGKPDLPWHCVSKKTARVHATKSMMVELVVLHQKEGFVLDPL
ncbi:hypothetical protein EJB05_16494 [Eragrostis curvula]|uniref:Secreted protein n=1 Tax=Eragrostis curvula TaxID=38414 RepID=A0A5J9VGQ2_9POAL|nr:hypothetical protein EJB05_16494 [Eragrostis curvula]